MTKSFFFVGGGNGRSGGRGGFGLWLSFNTCFIRIAPFLAFSRLLIGSCARLRPRRCIFAITDDRVKGGPSFFATSFPLTPAFHNRTASSRCVIQSGARSAFVLNVRPSSSACLAR